MDQLRTALNWLKRQHFWVLAVLVALIGLGCWWKVSRKMSALYDTNQKTITAEFTSLNTLRTAPFHPNETINTRQLTEAKTIAGNVTKLWEQLYDKQRVDVLKWPESLSKAFHDFIEKKQFGDEIPIELRNNYQNYIEQHFPALPKQIGARMLEAGVNGGSVGGRGGFGAEGGAPGMSPDAALQADNDYICEWLDQIVIRDELNFPQRPSALRIWVTQEDLWVYHTLLDVIAKTNQAAGATRMSNAAVKTVFSLQVGKWAAPYSRQPNHLAVPPPTASAGAAAEAGGTPGAAAPPEGAARPPQAEMGGLEGRMSGGTGSGAGLTPEQENAFLLSFRYLDDKGQPIPFGSAGAATPGGAEPAPVADPAATAGPAAPIDLSILGIGYKRLPIRMVLEMDGRWLPQLISACANQPLRVEVQEVRINPPDVAGAGGTGGASGMNSFRGFGGPGGGGATANLFPEETGVQSFPQQPNIVNVVIQGTIYIFNKPNPSLLAPPADPVAVN